MLGAERAFLLLLTSRSRSASVAALATLVTRDGLSAARDVLVPRPGRVRERALDDAIDWLCRTHDATGRQGSSKGYSLLKGWLPAYPETTGYVIGTLLAYSEREGGRSDLVTRAREMGDWEVSIQEPDGGITEGAIGTTPPRSIVFNTGMVLHGWVDLSEAGFEGYDDAARRAAHFLTENLGPDGTWDARFEYGALPHTYNSRVAWAMLRWARHTRDASAEAAARLQLDWVISRQRPNGWFDDCIFRTGMHPSTHGIAYTLRGLLESHVLTGEASWLAAVQRTSEALIRKLEVLPQLAADYDETWAPAVRHACLTGTVQLGGVWLRLFEVTHDPRWLNAGLKAVEQAASHQQSGRIGDVVGALPGSFPVWGRYAPLQYPNWATKFLADSLMLYEDLLA